MPDRFRMAAPLSMILLAGCVGGPAVPLPSAGTRPAASAAEPMRAPRTMQGPGLDGVIGARAPTLTARFGEPRIDLVEGDARKLQFAGGQCVLDIYLYPRRQGAAPVATHVEARLRQGGTRTRPEACMRAIESER